MYSRFAVSYSSLETARQPSRKGGCCAFTDDGVTAVSSVPPSKRKKKTAGQSELRDLLTSSLFRSVGRTSRPVLKYELVKVGEWDERFDAQRARLLLKPRGGFYPQHKNLCQHCDHPLSQSNT